MKKEDVIKLYRGLNQTGNLSGVKFTYAVARNLAVLKSEMEALEKATQPSEEYQAFDKLRVELVEKFAKKDKDGKSVIENGNYAIEDQKAFDKAFEKLKKENIKVFEAREKQIKDYQELLKEDVTVSLHKIKLESVPESITSSQMAQIVEIIEE